MNCPNCRAPLEVGKFEPNDSIVACPDCNCTFRLGSVRSARKLKKKRNVGNDAAAFFVSLVIPGAGHLVKNKAGDALVWFLSALACIMVAMVIVQQPGPGVLGVAAISLLSAVSAARA